MGAMSEGIQVNSLYLATEGEGFFIGRPQIFLRLQGCRVGCLNCDSKQTWEFAKSWERDRESVLREIEALSKGGAISWVSITGGDPLDHKHIPVLTKLISQLKQRGYFINLEASGVRIVPEIFQQVDFISFDYKPPSTGVKLPTELLAVLCENYKGKFQIKSVVQDSQDFFSCLERYRDLEGRGLVGEGGDFRWCLTPAWGSGEKFPGNRVLEVMELNYRHGSCFRVIIQQHKVIYGSQKEFV